MGVYRPRVHAELVVPIAGSTAERKAQSQTDETVTLPLRVSRLELERNDHNHADVARITADYADAGVDPRLLGNSVARVWIGEADEKAEWQPDHTNLEFIGIVRSITRHASTEEKIVEIEALDFTTLFIEAKPFPPEGVPRYGDSLEQGWKRICAHTGGRDAATGAWFSSVAALSNRLACLLIDPSLRLTQQLNKRLANASIPVKPHCDAWAVWQQFVGMFGLISYIDGDCCVVTTALDLFSSFGPPLFVWGRNILEISEVRDCSVAGKSIGVVSFDPFTGTHIEGFWPPKGQNPNKKLGAATSGGPSSAGHFDDIEMFEYEGVTDPDLVTCIARRIYEERSRQELQGTLRTVEMRAPYFTDGNALEATFDALQSAAGKGRGRNIVKLRPGEDVRVEWGLNEEDLDTIALYPTEHLRIAYLVRRGFQPAVAEVIAKNIGRFATFDQTFHVKRVVVTFDVSSEGKFEVEIGYVNKIKIDGSTQSPFFNALSKRAGQLLSSASEALAAKATDQLEAAVDTASAAVHSVSELVQRLLSVGQ